LEAPVSAETGAGRNLDLIFASENQVWKHGVSAETPCSGRIGPVLAKAKTGGKSAIKNRGLLVVFLGLKWV